MHRVSITMKTVEERAVRGVPWTILAYAANKLVTVGTTLALARLLTPKDFGLVALALLAILALSFLRDLGLNGVLVLRTDLDMRSQGTVLALMLIMGTVLAVLLAALSPLVADLFGEPRLEAVLTVLSVTVLLGGFTWFYETVLQRELEFKKRFFALSTQTLVYTGVALTLAVLGAGVWSLVAGQLAGTVAFAIALVAVAPYHVAPRLDLDTARDLLGDSGGFIAQGVTAFFQQNSDYVAVGRILGAVEVGFYSLAYRLAELPYWAIADPVARVTFPAFARMRHRGEDVRSSFLSTLRLVALVSCPFGVVLSGAADPFVSGLLGDEWLPMVGPLAVLGIWGAVRPVQVTVAWLLNSVGQAGLMGAISVVVLVVLIPALLIAADLGGITAVAWVMLADMVVSLVVLSWFAARRADVGVASQARAVGPVALACVPAWLAARGVAGALDDSAPLAALVAAALAGAAAYLAGVSLMAPGLLRTAVAKGARTIGRGPSATEPVA
jgi:O-antigen/teichoic acid export membrane protein